MYLASSKFIATLGDSSLHRNNNISLLELHRESEGGNFCYNENSYFFANKKVVNKRALS